MLSLALFGAVGLALAFYHSSARRRRKKAQLSSVIIMRIDKDDPSKPSGVLWLEYRRRNARRGNIHGIVVRWESFLAYHGKLDSQGTFCPQADIYLEANRSTRRSIILATLLPIL